MKTSPKPQDASMRRAVRAGVRFELRFRSLFRDGRGWSFPCDAEGFVDMDSLSEHALNNYLYARSMIGREVAMPSILPLDAAN